MACRTVQANLAHAHDLAPRVSALDRAELATYGVTDVLGDLLTGVTRSSWSRAFVQDGKTLCLWGIYDAPERAGVGICWLLSAEPAAYTDEGKRQLVRAAIDSVNERIEHYELLTGWSWAYATHHHKLLRRMGFELSEPTQIDRQGRPCPPTIFFERRRLSCSDNRTMPASEAAGVLSPAAAGKPDQG